MEIFIVILIVFVVIALSGPILAKTKTGRKIIRKFEFDSEEKQIVKTYDASRRQGEIVFYGASNFRLWKEMDTDMKPFIVQNHGFGGSTDQDLLERADTLLYPYKPSVVVFQTGSNDYVGMQGTESEVVKEVIKNKGNMFDTFHAALPDAAFVVMSGILMAGRSQYDGIVKAVNRALKEYCDSKEYMVFVDAEKMTVDENGEHLKEKFIKDGIHLTHEARLEWAEAYIKPAFEKIPGTKK